MTFLIWLSAVEGILVVALIALAGHLQNQLNIERQRLALLRRLR